MNKALLMLPEVNSLWSPFRAVLRWLKKDLALIKYNFSLTLLKHEINGRILNYMLNFCGFKS